MPAIWCTRRPPPRMRTAERSPSISCAPACSSLAVLRARNQLALGPHKCERYDGPLRRRRLMMMRESMTTSCSACSARCKLTSRRPCCKKADGKKCDICQRDLPPLEQRCRYQQGCDFDVCTGCSTRRRHSSSTASTAPQPPAVQSADTNASPRAQPAASPALVVPPPTDTLPSMHTVPEWVKCIIF